MIIEVEATEVGTAAEMVAALRTHEPGDTITIVVQRGDDEVDCAVELGSHLDVGG